MQGRICPHCFTRWYSSDSSTVWKCESCGYDIPVPKEESMEQIFIRTRNSVGEYYDKNINDTQYDERFDFYMGLSFGQVVDLLEKSLNLNKQREAIINE